MPNWCMNHIEFRGNPRDVAAIVDKVNQKSSVLDALVPIENWTYDGAIQTWGTKWSDSETTLHYVADGSNNGTAIAHADFDTAWAPPVEAMITASKDYPLVVICGTYWEPGMDFAGYFIALNGELIWDKTTNLPDIEQGENEDEQDFWERHSQEQNDFMLSLDEEMTEKVSEISTVLKARIVG
jgi:hypothetical protein